MKFQCDTAGRIPIYKQLIDQVRSAVARGRVKPGDRLPSVRQLSRELIVNPNTVARAYTELERDGVLVTQQGRGVFVAQPQHDLTESARRCRVESQLDELFVEAVHLGVSSEALTELFHARMKQFALDAESEEEDGHD